MVIRSAKIKEEIVAFESIMIIVAIVTTIGEQEKELESKLHFQDKEIEPHPMKLMNSDNNQSKRRNGAKLTATLLRKRNGCIKLIIGIIIMNKHLTDQKIRIFETFNLVQHLHNDYYFAGAIFLVLYATERESNIHILASEVAIMIHQTSSIIIIKFWCIIKMNIFSIGNNKRFFKLDDCQSCYKIAAWHCGCI